MSTEAAKKFLLEYAANPEAMRLLDEYPQPETPEDGARILSEIAGRLEVAFTAEEMAEAIEEAEAARRARTDAAAEDLTALPDDELEETAGGGNDTICFADYYCFGIYNTSPEGRTDVPCRINYNCMVVVLETKCEDNFSSTDYIETIRKAL